MFRFGEHKLCFYISTALWLRKYVFDFHITTQLKCHVTFWVEHPHPDSASYHVLRAMGLVNGEIKRFWFATLSCDRCVTWLCEWGFLFLSHHPAKIGVHRLCENGNTSYFICQVTMYWSVTWLFGWGLLILSHQTATFGFYRPCECGDITFLICLVITISKFHLTFWMGSPHPKSPTC